MKNKGINRIMHPISVSHARNSRKLRLLKGPPEVLSGALFRATGPVRTCLDPLPEYFHFFSRQWIFTQGHLQLSRPSHGLVKQTVLGLARNNGGTFSSTFQSALPLPQVQLSHLCGA